ncbi:IMP cyclohydrolase-like protein [Paenibacillus sp. UNCCL117]|uniref:IMP cyclohydrolase n=1 Tax=unclassified Paenibacillus TaxID=185978 RepID=UPI00087F73C2|nr:MULTISPECIES: IMP cyclohydrolase [unclassified Paenibacillus]SDE08507.1 IMP cyclohydrolase-like protein [Paenibacillus sp. cl123]SFW58939.1 IMP cyclohydrolase-like protein [Paenibacillus sp. UNCCL117]
MTHTRAAQAEAYLAGLQENVYPGRGIIIGLTPDGTRLIQVYWIMGRSENSRNRVFIEEPNGFLRTEAKDPAKLTDPSLIIYYPVKHAGGAHIVTNGDQTDTIHEALQAGGSFESALATRTYEPDAPNFTPRISGIVDLNDKQFAYKLSILKSAGNTEDQTLRHTYAYEKALPGFGHCIHTYAGDGNPLPSFQGEPALVPLANDAEEIANLYWSALNEENKISLLVKTIRIEDGASELLVRNKE